MIVKRKDLPDRVQELIEAEENKYGQRHAYPQTVQVRVVDIAEVPHIWHDANYRSIYAVDLERGVVGGVSGSTASEMVSEVSRMAVEGGRVPLANNQAMVVFNTYPKSVEVYLHHSNVKPDLLAAGPPLLTSAEWIVLRVTQAFISSYRKEVFRKIPSCNSRIEDLKGKGYLDKRGALTFEGKRTLESITPEVKQEVREKARKYDIWDLNL